MENFVLGVTAAAAIVVVYILGMMLGFSQIASDCDRVGGFHFNEKTFICTEKK